MHRHPSGNPKQSWSDALALFGAGSSILFIAAITVGVI